MGKKRKHKPAIESELQKWRRRRQAKLTVRARLGGSNGEGDEEGGEWREGSEPE